MRGVQLQVRVHHRKWLWASHRQVAFGVVVVVRVCSLICDERWVVDVLGKCSWLQDDVTESCGGEPSALPKTANPRHRRHPGRMVTVLAQRVDSVLTAHFQLNA